MTLKNEKFVIYPRFLGASGRMEKAKKLRNPKKFKKIVYTRMDADYLIEMLDGKSIVNITIYEVEGVPKPVIRIDDRLLAPNVAEWRETKDFEGTVIE